MIYLNGNDFYIGGSSVFALEQRNILVIKYSGTIAGITVDNNTEGITTFPNPANQSVVFRIPSFINANTLLTLYDSYGRTLLKQKMLLGTDNLIDIHTFQAGIYLFTISSPAGVIYQGKISRAE